MFFLEFLHYYFKILLSKLYIFDNINRIQFQVFHIIFSSNAIHKSIIISQNVNFKDDVFSERKKLHWW